VATRVLLREDGHDWEATLDGDAVSLAGVDGAFAVRDLTDGRWEVELGSGKRGRGVAVRAGDVVWVSLAGELFSFAVVTETGRPRGTTSARDALTPPMPATVVRVAVTVGDAVKEGDTVVVLEAMKMELAVRAPMAGTVRAVNCKAGDLVQPGLVLLDIDGP
jgi:acetyl/propionyl-CoA carboxylase alpha subunit